MEVVLLITALSPWLPTSAAEALALRSPLSVTAADQAEREPDSNPSAKITSPDVVAVGVRVAVKLAVGVRLGVKVGVNVRVAVCVAVAVGVRVLVPVAVKVNVAVEVPVAVNVGV
jgi:hypothetical protein